MSSQTERWAAVVTAMKEQATSYGRGGMTAIAKRLGTERGTISKYLSGELKGERIPFDKLEHFESLLGIAKYSIVQQADVHQKNMTIKTDLKTIHVYASAGAGAGIEMSSMEPLFSVTAPPSYFYRSDFAVLVNGHSMEPTIPHQSVVGIREVENFQANELYVACIPYEGLVVKRVAVDRERGDFIFKSDNPDKEAYPDFREPIDSAMKIIMGRVVWLMQGY